MIRLPDPARSRAVLIGASRYTDGGLPALPAVRANLTDLYAALTSRRGTGLPGTQCLMETDPADAATVGERLAVVAREAEDLLLVYYAGHGLTWTHRNELYLALGNTRMTTVGTSALRCADVRQVFLDSPARTRVLILDCCLAGRAVEQAMAGPARALLDQFDVHGAYVLTATGPNAPAMAPAGARNTLFTGELLRLLNDGIPGGPPWLTLDVLYRQIKASFSRRNLPEPTCNNSDTAAHLALAGNAAHAPRISDREVPPRPGAEPEGRDYPALRAALGAALDELVAEEAATVETYRMLLDKIAEPGLPPLATRAAGLVARLAGLDGSAAAGHWARVTGELDALSREIAEARTATLRQHAVARGPLDRREELRGRARAWLAKAVRAGVAEKVAAQYEQARDLLWSKPCDLRKATCAVTAFRQAVQDASDNGREGA